MSRRLLSLAWMTSVWIALWGDISVANVLGGVLVGSIISVLAPSRGLAPDLRFRPFSALRLAVYFSWEVVVASVIVAWEVLTPSSRLNQAVVAVPLHTGSRVIAALVGNMISLTPGTLTLEVLGDPPVLYVHVLDLHTEEHIHASVHRLEALALRSFGAESLPPDRQYE